MTQDDIIKTTLEDISQVKKRLLVEVASREVQKKLNQAYRDLGKQARVPGFRPGKIPREILERRFGAQVEEDVTRNIMGDTLPKAIDEFKAFPLGPPVIEKEALKKGEAFTYSARLEIRPEFELKDCTGLTVDKEIMEVTDTQVDEQLIRIRESQGKLNAVEDDGPLKAGDMAVIDYKGFEDDKPLDGIEASNFMLKLGSNDFHSDFEDALVGLKKGEEKKFHVDFEADFRHSGLAGRHVDFQVTITDVKEMVVPDLDDAFVKGLDAELETVDDLKTKLRETITAQEEKRIDREVKQRLLETIAASVDFELPQVLVQNELDFALENVNQNLIRSGSSLEKAGLSPDKLREEFRPAAEKRVKEVLILGEIAGKENISVSEEDLEESFNNLAAEIGQDADMLRKYYEARNMLDSMKDKLLEEKTLKYLLENAKIAEKKKIELKNKKSE